MQVLKEVLVPYNKISLTIQIMIKSYLKEGAALDYLDDQEFHELLTPEGKVNFFNSIGNQFNIKMNDAIADCQQMSDLIDFLIDNRVTKYILVEEEETKEAPYKTKVIPTVYNLLNRDYPQNNLCFCGHPYHRHFDSHASAAEWYEEPELPDDPPAVGCKYCDCMTFSQNKEEWLKLNVGDNQND